MYECSVCGKKNCDPYYVLTNRNRQEKGYCKDCVLCANDESIYWIVYTSDSSVIKLSAKVDDLDNLTYDFKDYIDENNRTTD